MKAKVRCIYDPFYDDVELKERKYKGDEYVISLERAEYLKEHNAVEILETFKEEKSEVEELKEDLLFEAKVVDTDKVEVKPIKKKKSSKK